MTAFVPSTFADVKRGDLIVTDSVHGQERVLTDPDHHYLGATGIDCVHLHLQNNRDDSSGRFIVRGSHEPVLRWV